MAVPATPILCAPSDADNTFGRAIMSSEIIAGLKKLNGEIWADMTYSPGVWYPGKATGNTCLWLGPSGSRERSKKLTGFVPGPIPEFTQIAPNGLIITKGWRAIFSRIMKAKAATKVALEQHFKVNLDVEGKDVLCPPCRKRGLRVRSEFASGLCQTHETAQRMAARALDVKNERRYLNKKYGIAPSQGKGVTNADVHDHGAS